MLLLGLPTGDPESSVGKLLVVHHSKEQRMKRARIGIIAATIFAVASVAFAQAKPDFSGTWTLDPEASGMAAVAAVDAAAVGHSETAPRSSRRAIHSPSSAPWAKTRS